MCMEIHNMHSLLIELPMLICDYNLEGIKIAILQEESIEVASEDDLETMP